MLNNLFDEGRRREIRSALENGKDIELRRSRRAEMESLPPRPLSDGEFQKPPSAFLRKSKLIEYCPKCGTSRYRDDKCKNPACGGINRSRLY